MSRDSEYLDNLAERTRQLLEAEELVMQAKSDIHRYLIEWFRETGDIPFFKIDWTALRRLAIRR